MTKSSNSDFSWSLFDSEAYFQHYYGEPHVDDDNVIFFACKALAEAEPRANKLDIVDVGTGPNLFPMMCALPRAARLTAWEYSSSNVDWIRAELAKDQLRPQFEHFWTVAKRSYSEEADIPVDALAALAERTRIVQGSIYDLPGREWDAATMFFCAESITADKSEFDLACRRFARCVRPGGALVAAFLIGSSSYEIAERPFPILNVMEDDIRRAFSQEAEIIDTQAIGIVEKEIRSGYAGMLFLSARSI